MSEEKNQPQPSAETAGEDKRGLTLPGQHTDNNFHAEDIPFNAQPGARSTIPQHVKELWQLGAQGKLYTFVVEYKQDGSHYRIKQNNLTLDEILAKRESMYRYGFTRSVGKGHWVVISPNDFVRVEFFKQAQFMPG